ncbi:MAG TPA: HAMP domain-containing sensor histidine kinase [Deltaproteobacteria bacterium]|nr:HAMP domain-containing sensor histidine kinase [Deltaproteobacteria bacterium]
MCLNATIGHPSACMQEIRVPEGVPHAWDELLETARCVLGASSAFIVRTVAPRLEIVSSASPKKAQGSSLSLAARVRRQCEEAAASGEVVVRTSRSHRRHGRGSSPTLSSTISAPLSWPTGAPFGAVCVVGVQGCPCTKEELAGIVRAFSRLATRILENALLSADLEAALREVSRLAEERERFLGVAAHDMKNALNAFLGCCRHLLPGADELDARRRRFLELAHSSATTLIQLMDELMDIARIESAARAPSSSTPDAREVILECIHMHRHLAEAKGIMIDLVLPKTDITAPIDSTLLACVMNNLLSNAVKFSPNGASVVVSVEVQQGNVVVRVTDHGPGIPREEQPRLFRPFQKASPRPSGEETSTGLGLYIARRIVEGHGGSIWVESEPGKGATFSFTISSSSSTRPAGAEKEGTADPGVRP